MTARPKRGDTEDNLLEFQEQFIDSGFKPAATVVRAKREGPVTGEKRAEHRSSERDVVTLQGLPQELPSSLAGHMPPPKKRSKFKERRMARQKLKSEMKEEDYDAAELLEKHDDHVSTVLTQIRERDIKRSHLVMPAVVQRGFPAVFHRGNITENSTNTPSNKKGKKSLFAQQFLASGPSMFGVPMLNPQPPPAFHTKDNPIPHTNVSKTPVLSSLSSSNIISGEGLMAATEKKTAIEEVSRIHTENLDKLAAMSEQEIHEEQARLKAALDPGLISFLQSRQKKRTTEQKASVKVEEEMDIDNVEEKPKAPTNCREFSSKLSGGNSLHYSQDTEMVSANGGKPMVSDKRLVEDRLLEEKHVHFAKEVSIVAQDGGLENIEEVNELVRLGTSEKWVNMDKVESDKVEWMKDCPTPSAVEKKDGNQARFAFDGSLVARTADIPVNLGLHHHGDDPGAAGYTLEELFLLSRSSFLQQRVLALQTLARIIIQDGTGAFHGILHDTYALLPTLLDAGILFLLRWALDDSTDAVMAAAIQGFAAILVVPADQHCADEVFEWYHGHELPSLRPVDEESKEKSRDEEEEENPPTDAELIKQDVIKGLLQMHLLPRLRYVLEVCHPLPIIVRSILAILTRIARHSSEAAHEVTKCPRLMETVFSHFLPISWKSVQEKLEDATNVYGMPLCEAMRLMRAICSAGRHVAATLISRHNLIGRILCYTALHPKDIQLAYEDAVVLSIESLRTWTVCMSYGLACNQFRETYTTFIQCLRAVQGLSLVHDNDVSLTFELSRASALLRLLDAIIHVAGTTAELHAKMTAGASQTDQDDGMESDNLSPPPVNWSHVMGFLPLVGCALGKWVKELFREGVTFLHTLENASLSLLSTSFNLIASFYSKLPTQPSFSPVESLEEVEDLLSTILLPLADSALMTSLLQQLRKSKHSNSYGIPGSTSRGIASLPDYGSMTRNHNAECSDSVLLPSSVTNGQVISLLTSFTRLLCSVINVHKGVAQQFLAFVTRLEVAEYLNGIISNTEVLAHCAFARFELHLQYFMVKLFYYVRFSILSVVNQILSQSREQARSVEDRDLSVHQSTYHTAALVLFSRLRAGDEYYAHDLMTNVLFNPEFYPESKDSTSTGVAEGLSELTIRTEEKPTPPQPVTTDIRSNTRGELLCEAHKNLIAVRSTFIGSFGRMRHDLAVSRASALHQPHDIQSLLLPSDCGPLLHTDWMFGPIVDLHNHVISAEMKGRGVDEVPNVMISTVTCTLQLILLLEEWRPVSLRSVTMVARVARLMCIFLTGSDLFLDRRVHNYVWSLLQLYAQPVYLKRLDFNGPVPGLTSFYDLYTSLLSHYSAVSFGDALFACFVVLPLAQRHGTRFRHVIWDEHVGTLRSLSLPVCQVPIPLENFLYPVERDEALLNLYLRALATQAVRPQWCPLFYLLAVHHVNAFIYHRIDPQDTISLNRKLLLLQHVMLVKLEDVKHDLLYYYKPVPDSSSAKAFEVFTSLPPDREILLRNRDDIQECRRLYSTMSTDNLELVE